MSEKPEEQLWKFQAQHKRMSEKGTAAFYDWYKDKMIPDWLALQSLPPCSLSEYGIPHSRDFPRALRTID
ncbi:hypothetical protein DL764_007908 [Monosporascus ibericus]|uniref:Uncharacterized protein n=1 Tax=Monosporascus ibericus TaxID=155417 RepID=A0A4Q4T1X4_9PEZI|nr:hypothetical protein DL764_007908 [Monosporascus ibericus]